MKKRLVLLLALVCLVVPPAFADDAEALFSQILGLAEKGNPEAQYHAGMMYHNGMGVRKNPAKAFEWFRKSAAGKAPLAEYKLGRFYDGQGEGIVKQDPAKALEHKLKAAKAGYMLAQHDVAALYMEQKNNAEAFKWVKAAADQGNPMSLYNVSMFYNEGLGTAKNPAEAYHYFKLAQLAARGEVNGNAKSALDKLAKDMTAEQRAAADKRVKEWKPQPTALTLQALQGARQAVALTESAR